jgi:hypothetical protein
MTAHATLGGLHYESLARRRERTCEVLEVLGHRLGGDSNLAADL